jgi:hypothetical protein
LVYERFTTLEASLCSMQEVETSISGCQQWMDAMQAQVKAAESPVGPSTQHAQASLQHFEVGTPCITSIIVAFIILVVTVVR